MDTLTKAERSEQMARVRNKDTKPEWVVRRMLHSLGYRYRLHRRDLPGSPDLVFPSRKVVVFVHGCFWHGHHCPRGKAPSSNKGFWNKKISGNKTRDLRNTRALRRLGWSVITLWE
ncbi:MAG: DNA mismatch endonuclease Vsr [Rhizobiales bacterium]|nr:DNA mismatch endonuclease Vsr [Hyphomicrobiales bacterium]